MKSMIMLLLMIFAIALYSCNSGYDEKDKCSVKTLTYIIHFPNKSSIRSYKGNICQYSLSSHRGTNELSVRFTDQHSIFKGPIWLNLESTSAPIEIVSLKP